MFQFFKELFTDNRIPSISFLDFYKKINRLKEDGLFPFEYNLPQAISLPESFWKEVVSIHKMTLGDGLEREISIFMVDGELIFTSVMKGQESSVTSNHNISVKYVQHPTRKGYFRKEVYTSVRMYITRMLLGRYRYNTFLIYILILNMCLRMENLYFPLCQNRI